MGGGVSLPCNLVDVVEAAYTQNRPESLLAQHLHFAIGVSDHRGLTKWPGESNVELPAAIDAPSLLANAMDLLFTRHCCASETDGPTWLPSANAGPSRTDPAASTTPFRGMSRTTGSPLNETQRQLSVEISSVAMFGSDRHQPAPSDARPIR